MKDKITNYLKEHNFYEIDYTQPFYTQYKVGDILITTNMYIFKGFGDDTEIYQEYFNEEIEKDFRSFVIADVDEDGFIILAMDEEEEWFEPEGRIFIKRQEIEYVTMFVPTFRVEQVRRLGGEIIGRNEEDL